jgi:hypothetical protein
LTLAKSAFEEQTTITDTRTKALSVSQGEVEKAQGDVEVSILQVQDLYVLLVEQEHDAQVCSTNIAVLLEDTHTGSEKTMEGVDTTESVKV